MASEQLRLSPADRDNLVAYIDGELNEAESRAIATKLTQSPTARREVEILERTWELLEHLPRPAPSEDFTERTLTGIRKIDAEGGRFEEAFVGALRGLGRLAVWLGVAALAFVGGYLLTARVWHDPTRRLTRDLSIAEHLDEYRDAGNLEFLKQLSSAPAFSGDRDD